MKKFVCSRCGACCRWPGAVKLTDAEVDAIAGFLNIPLADFLEIIPLSPLIANIFLCVKKRMESVSIWQWTAMDCRCA